MTITERQGGGDGYNGNEFDDILSLGNPLTAIISRITIRHSDVIEDIKVVSAYRLFFFILCFC